MQFIFSDSDAIDYTMRLGDYKSKLRDGTEEEFSIEKIILHEGYDKAASDDIGYSDNDIALIKVLHHINNVQDWLVSAKREIFSEMKMISCYRGY